jgi:hypothetical protein
VQHSEGAARRLAPRRARVAVARRSVHNRLVELKEELMADLVDQTLEAVRARLRELAPMVSEYQRLESAYAALDGAGGAGAGRGGAAGTATRVRRSRGTRREPGRAASRGRRARRGENKAAVYGAIAQRPGVTVAEIAGVTGIGKPLIYNATRAGVDSGELERVALPSGQNGFRTTPAAPTDDPDSSAG